MPTSLKRDSKVLPPRRYPTPKRRPARLSSEVAKYRGHNQKKAKSR